MYEQNSTDDPIHICGQCSIVSFCRCSVKERIQKVLAYTQKPHEILHTPPKKVLILGSGGLSIGQAGEFDYSGSQV